MPERIWKIRQNKEDICSRRTSRPVNKKKYELYSVKGMYNQRPIKCEFTISNVEKSLEGNKSIIIREKFRTFTGS